jgi:hypothetical protein
MIPTTEDDCLAFLRFDFLLMRYLCAVFGPSKKAMTSDVALLLLDSIHCIEEACWNELILLQLLKPIKRSKNMQAFVVEVIGMPLPEFIIYLSLNSFIHSFIYFSSTLIIFLYIYYLPFSSYDFAPSALFFFDSKMKLYIIQVIVTTICDSSSTSACLCSPPH